MNKSIVQIYTHIQSILFDFNNFTSLRNKDETRLYVLALNERIAKIVQL